MNTIQSEWEGFSSKVMHTDAPKRQRIEMRRSFYAGARSMLVILKEMADAGFSEEAAEAVLCGLDEESAAFFEGVVAGKEGF